MDLRANTAVDVLIGPFVDKTDGNTTEDGLTLTAAEIKLSKNGQSLTLKSDVTSAAFDDDGYYNCELDVTDTNTEGNLVLIVHQSANALPVRHEYNVLSEAAWDSLYVAKDTGFMDVNIKAVSDDTDSADNLELDYDGTGYAKANSTIGTTTTNTDMVGTNSAALASVCTETRLAELAAANLPTDIAAIKTETALIVADTNELQADDVPTLIATAQADLNTITGTGGVELATGQTAAWASALEASASTIKEGAAKAGTLSTTQMSTTMTEADDVFNDRVLIFKSDTATAALRLQATDITDYANTNGVLTFTAVTTAPSATDTFIIV